MPDTEAERAKSARYRERNREKESARSSQSREKARGRIDQLRSSSATNSEIPINKGAHLAQVE